MKTFKNKNFTKRDYETTNVVFCESEIAPNANWIECDPKENTLNYLSSETYSEKGVYYNVKFYGWL